MTKNLITFLFVVFAFHAVGQKKMTRTQYIAKYKDIAIENMRNHKVPASITLAQGVLESGDGNSD